jgi:hypothetical protein
MEERRGGVDGVEEENAKITQITSYFICILLLFGLPKIEVNMLYYYKGLRFLIE